MLRRMSLVQQWQRVRSGLPADWSGVRLALRLADGQRSAEVATLLGPLAPGRVGDEFRFQAARRGAGPSPESVARILARLDEARIAGTLDVLELELGAADVSSAPRTLVEAWDGAVVTLPADWSDLYVELELTSSDHLEPAALALAPVNPARYGETSGFRFRCARRFGYGASPGMSRRCFARLDERGIPGELHLLWVLSDTKPVATQGPVWYVSGKVV
jgi:hypothetical protein